MKEGSKRKMVGDGKEERAFLGFIFQATSAIILHPRLSSLLLGGGAQVQVHGETAGGGGVT